MRTALIIIPLLVMVSGFSLLGPFEDMGVQGRETWFDNAVEIGPGNYTDSVMTRQDDHFKFLVGESQYFQVDISGLINFTIHTPTGDTIPIRTGERFHTSIDLEPQYFFMRVWCLRGGNISYEFELQIGIHGDAGNETDLHGYSDKAMWVEPGEYSGMVGQYDPVDWMKFMVDAGSRVVLNLHNDANSDADGVRANLFMGNDPPYLYSGDNVGHVDLENRWTEFLTSNETRPRIFYLGVYRIDDNDTDPDDWHEIGVKKYKITITIEVQNETGDGRDLPGLFKYAPPIIQDHNIYGSMGMEDERDIVKFQQKNRSILYIDLNTISVDSIQIEIYSRDMKHPEKVLEPTNGNLMLRYNTGASLHFMDNIYVVINLTDQADIGVISYRVKFHVEYQNDSGQGKDSSKDLGDKHFFPLDLGNHNTKTGFSGYLDDDGDTEDWYEFFLEKGEKITISATPKSGGYGSNTMSLFLRLITPNHEVIDNGGFPGKSATIEYAAEESENATLIVEVMEGNGKYLVTFNSLSPIKPFPPRNVYAFSSNDDIVIFWDPPRDEGIHVRGYRIYEYFSESNEYRHLQTVDLGVEHIILRDPQTGYHQYAVRAYNNRGESAYDGLAFIIFYGFGWPGDNDRDMMYSNWEMSYGLDPFNASDANQDPDGDGYSNYNEFRAGSDPLDKSSTPDHDIGKDDTRDSDGDGMFDDWEIQYGLDMYDSSDKFTDLDGDGLSNYDEFLMGTDVNNKDLTVEDDDGISIVSLAIIGLIFLLVSVIINLLIIRFYPGKEEVEEIEDPDSNDMASPLRFE